MAITVANTANTNTFEYWINRTNELAVQMSGSVLTSDATGNTNVTSGNSVLDGDFKANTITVGNSSVSISIAAPNTTVQSSGRYYLNANGSWTVAPAFSYTANLSATSATLIDSFDVSDFNVVDYVISVKTNAVNNFVSSRLMLTHNTGDSQLSEYSMYASNTSFATFSANISGTTVRLYLTPSITNTTVKFVRLAI